MMTWGIPYSTGVFHDYWVTVLFPNEVRFDGKSLLWLLFWLIIALRIYQFLVESNYTGINFDLHDWIHVRNSERSRNIRMPG